MLCKLLQAVHRFSISINSNRVVNGSGSNRTKSCTLYLQRSDEHAPPWLKRKAQRGLYLPVFWNKPIWPRLIDSSLSLFLLFHLQPRAFSNPKNFNNEHVHAYIIPFRQILGSRSFDDHYSYTCPRDEGVWIYWVVVIPPTHPDRKRKPFSGSRLISRTNQKSMLRIQIDHLILHRLHCGSIYLPIPFPPPRATETQRQLLSRPNHPFHSISLHYLSPRLSAHTAWHLFFWVVNVTGPQSVQVWVEVISTRDIEVDVESTNPPSFPNRNCQLRTRRKCFFVILPSLMALFGHD